MVKFNTGVEYVNSQADVGLLSPENLIMHNFPPRIKMCGWLKDKFGVSWEIVPNVLREMLQDKDANKLERVMQALLQMKKINIQGLRIAYTGNRRS